MDMDKFVDEMHFKTILIDKFVDVMHFKTILIYVMYKDELNTDSFEEYFSNSFTKFCEEFETTKEMDPDFYEIDKDILNVTTKIVDYIRKNRETITDYDEDKAIDILSFINQKYYDTSDKKRKNKKREYLSRERAIRELLFLKDDEVVETIQADFVVYDYFTNPKVKDIPYHRNYWGRIISKEIVYHTKYFSKLFPELYEDPMVLEKTLCAAEDVQNQEYERRNARKEAKTIIKKMNNSEK